MRVVKRVFPLKSPVFVMRKQDKEMTHGIGKGPHALRFS